jgi:hypothetical protein
LPRILEISEAFARVKSDCRRIVGSLVNLNEVVAKLEEAVVKAGLIMVSEKVRVLGDLVGVFFQLDKEVIHGRYNFP